MSKIKKVAIWILSIILLIGMIFTGSYSFAKYKYNSDLVKNETSKEDTSEAPEVEEKNYETETNIKNILLVGVDTRGDYEDSKTDTIIIATIDPNTKKVKLTSLMRDMYVEIPGKGYNKINSAFQIGGIELLKKTIRYNFDLNIDYYASIDFQGFQSLIDKVGGIELDVKKHEVNEINKYIEEVNGSKSTVINKEGMQFLNGQQALSYCRIRKVGNSDYERTERQRRVLSLLLSKLKEVNTTKLPSIYSTISPYVKTDISFGSVLKLGYTVYNFDSYTPDTLRLPVDNCYKDTYIKGMSVLIPNLKETAIELHKFIYPSTESYNVKVPDNSSIYNGRKAEITTINENVVSM
ncbi:LCP family protein [Clostridium magnum]|uniref:Regulatory protein MsrR n=1 Tax=Clostridium magnum DSM 2767 TaxID=1121326 RepID=A0A161XA84_9CLOT|nr:LCP family protein [Clostridium magnum]KZL91176.1 regulatory protein MsrR [Clostridium magnum DSM 2767]SHI17606.1 transcriptional attenuator, LytR family [Clostridium magnum DSM 2767]